ncbi:hypothetical protein OIU79_008220 [Salix purpurea]|uniref:Uncharacterized protein n=1 Tax=Salix purpurea TaxID=77065 RepID=A0A9Q0TI26_SALPP|nr:hypothetical protein OIU79_008220 [Salix purpurea]
MDALGEQNYLVPLSYLDDVTVINSRTRTTVPPLLNHKQTTSLSPSKPKSLSPPPISPWSPPPQTPEDNHKEDQNVNIFLHKDGVFSTPSEDPSLSSSQNQHEQQEEEVAVDLAKEDQLVEGQGIDEIMIVDGGDCNENSREKDLEFIEEADLTGGIEIEGHLGVGKSFERLVKSLDRFNWTPRASVGDESVKCDERLLKTVDAIPAKSKRAKRLDTNPGLGSSRSSLLSETERRRENFGYSVEKLGSDEEVVLTVV